MGKQTGSGVLTAIALFKLVKVVTLVAVAVGALSLSQHADAFKTARDFVREVGIDPNYRFISAAISKVSGIQRRRLEELGVGSFVYAAVFLVEGTGLLLRKHWAEYLTVVVTASLIPFEIYEIVREPSALKGVGLLVNALIVAYLILRLWREHKQPARAK
jgi:uncharacterized membrane protein (DUF2068 family)